ncbi:MAG: hypothetical protein UY81_C0031G0005 [Candidatus Giovannonibacteria bacterium GW2011_GWA2_53_7]|uniref:Uncharacterized protein n=1 Tax=Candidatus Giovannonibacteria bacterium GW2011_GWA2_53_7 TaxID=1618650 RepID=A0A0G2ATH9_9BACT|nr:MAG: hypothetical protein UY81_C0031G0005 [Candidatus Giovannonibacteria bacterium GW2011_GWA2_53_7]
MSSEQLRAVSDQAMAPVPANPDPQVDVSERPHVTVTVEVPQGFDVDVRVVITAFD